MARGKRFAAGVLLAALATAGLVSCGQSETKGGTIELWHIQVYHPTVDVVEGAAARFGKSHPGVKVEAMGIANDPFKTKLQVAVMGGDVPDVFHTWGGGVLGTYVKAGVVADLTEALAKRGGRQRFSPLVSRFVSFDGKMYAVPADVSLVVMWYNKKVFAQHGVETPKTWEELKAVCRRLKDKGVTPIALGNIDQWPGCFFFDYLATRIGGTKPLADAAGRAPGGTFENAAFVEAGKKVRELVELGAFAEGASGLKDDEARDLFFTGKTAMYLMGTWTLAHVSTKAPGFAPDMGCFAFPAVEGGTGSPKTVLGGVNAGYAVSAKSADLEAARELAMELVSDETCKAWAATGRIPALGREAAEPLLPETTKPAAQILFAADEIQLYYDQYLPPALAEKHKETTTDIFTGKRTPEAAARAMEEAAREFRP